MKYKLEIFDHLQYLYAVTGFNDHQLHCVIKFIDTIDASIMEKAVNLLIKTIPVLSRVCRNYNNKSYWEDIDMPKWPDLFSIVYTKKDFDKFTFSKINEEIGPQLKACLFKADKDSLSILLTHMVTDGAGAKQCIYLLADIYSNLIKNPEYTPGYIIDGERSFKKVISKIRFIDKIKILFLNNKDNNQKNNLKFPMDNSTEIFPFILFHNVPLEIYHGIKQLSKKYQVTVNDIILTAYFRVLTNILQLNGTPLGLPIMIDMRRYLKNKSFNALSNLSSTVVISTTVQPDESFHQTLTKISSEMSVKKNNYLGLNTFIKLDVIFKIFRSNLSYKILKNALKNPSICMTNIGIIDSKKLIFAESSVQNVVICGSIKYHPHFQMSISTFEDKITFGVNLYGSSNDQKNILNFFSSMDNELKSIF